MLIRRYTSLYSKPKGANLIVMVFLYTTMCNFLKSFQRHFPITPNSPESNKWNRLSSQRRLVWMEVSLIRPIMPNKHYMRKWIKLDYNLTFVLPRTHTRHAIRSKTICLQHFLFSSVLAFSTREFRIRERGIEESVSWEVKMYDF